MKRLYNLVTLVTNNKDCVVLKVKENSFADLISLGCFNGNETLFRLTKGLTQTCTVWTTKGNNYSWSWGEGGHTLVTDQLTKQGQLIQSCIEDDFDIKVQGKRESILLDMERSKHDWHTIKIWTIGGPFGVGCQKDGEFLRRFKTAAEAIKHFEECGYEVQTERPGIYHIRKRLKIEGLGL